MIWLIALLANQSVMIYNLKHKDAPRDLITEEEVELLTSPLELASYKNAITECIFKGTARNVLSEGEGDGSKNTTAG